MTTTSLQIQTRQSVAAAPQKCAVCESEIVDDHPFCKIHCEKKSTAVLCSPRCALRYFDALHPITNLEEQDRAEYERNAHFLVNGEMP